MGRGRLGWKGVLHCNLVLQRVLLLQQGHWRIGGSGACIQGARPRGQGGGASHRWLPCGVVFQQVSAQARHARIVPFRSPFEPALHSLANFQAGCPGCTLMGMP